MDIFLLITSRLQMHFLRIKYEWKIRYYCIHKTIRGNNKTIQCKTTGNTKRSESQCLEGTLNGMAQCHQTKCDRKSKDAYDRIRKKLKNSVDVSAPGLPSQRMGLIHLRT